jgi:hypothetical protein
MSKRRNLIVGDEPTSPQDLAVDCEDMVVAQTTADSVLALNNIVFGTVFFYYVLNYLFIHRNKQEKITVVGHTYIGVRT